MNLRSLRCLYKYYSFDKKNHYEDILFRDTLYFSSPKYFNDPFDRGLNITFSGKSKRYIKNYLIKQILPNYFDNFDKDKETKARDFIDKNYSNLDPNIKDNEFQLQKNQLNFVLSSGIFCLSESNDNILMWSHYADKHSGFCVAFNLDALVNTILKYNEINEAIIYARKVIYKRKYPRVSGYKKDQVDSLFTKAFFWRDEKEWRFFYDNGAGKIIPLPKNIISAIYMGLEIEPTNEKIIKKAVSEKNYNLCLYKAKKIKSKFALCFEKIS